MYLLIDNYDSFTYNLWHYLGELGAAVEVRRNDALTAAEALAMKPKGIILSPVPAIQTAPGFAWIWSPPRPRRGCPFWGYAWATRP